jgi:glycyl-tRNA synthetase
MTNDKMEKIVSLAKRRGFIFQGSEIYGGLAGTWDYGPYGVALKNNIKNIWWKQFVLDREDMYGLDAAILMNPKTWEASGHVGGFSDPLVECEKCKKRFRSDHLENKETCPDCGGKLGEEKQFNMMFKTNIGATEDASSISYLRPETAQGIFVNFKNVLDTMHPKLPFGIAQIGKAFRNEIAPRDFIFRTREFEQMEIEYFVHPETWKENFEALVKDTKQFFKNVGLSSEKVYELEISKEDLAHYSQRTIDFEFEYPFGKKELSGLAYRTDFDLQSHIASSGQKLEYLDQDTNQKVVPHVIEPSFGIDRLVLAILSEAYTEDEMDGEVRTYLKLAPAVAPVKVAVFPLLKNRPELVEKARDIYAKIKKEIPQAIFDDSGTVGKRYRRQDEIGTPFCITVDFETIEQGAGVTIRDRDTGQQERVSEDEIIEFLKTRF